MRIPILKLTQDDNVFYLGKIKARDLMSIATTQVRKSYNSEMHTNYLREVDEHIKEKIENDQIWYLKDVGDDSNIQREESKTRLIDIGKYISKSNSIFPNSIIISLNMRDPNANIEDTIIINEDSIEFDDEKVVATIIDGQHRLGGFNYTDRKDYYLDNFELAISIMINLDVAIQADLFATINGKQKPVNKSILYDLSELTEEEYTEIVTAHLVVKWFNVNEKSPLFNKIKMLGYGPGTISQSALIDAILPLIVEKKNIKPEVRVFPVLRKYYLNEDSSSIMRHLYNYFRSYKSIFEEEWNYDGTDPEQPRYILNKTTGLSAILYAYPTIYAYCDQVNDHSYDNLCELVNRLKINDFTFNSEDYRGGGRSIQYTLADEILKIMFGSEVYDIRSKWIENNKY